MSEKVKIESIKLKLGKREVTLTIEQAKELKAALEELFGKEIIHEHHGWWYWYVPAPVISPPQPSYPYCGDPLITWTTDTYNAVMDGSTLVLSTS